MLHSLGLLKSLGQMLCDRLLHCVPLTYYRTKLEIEEIYKWHAWTVDWGTSTSGACLISDIDVVTNETVAWTVTGQEKGLE